MSKRRIGITLFVLSLLSTFWIAPVQALRQGGGWSEPYRLSSEAGKASEGYLAADQYGYVHCFWTEILFDNEDTVIKYARFDGSTWSKPNDIYVTDLEIRNVSPVVDQQGILHIAWSEGFTGLGYSAYYSYAPANDALSAQDWAKPVRINVEARPVYLQVDSKGVLHLLYINPTEESGVYYVRSEDRGITISDPLWLDPDILPDHIPDSLDFELDENGGLHAAWFYGSRERGARPDWVRYIHSLDGGHTWSSPFLIDQYREEGEHNLTNASPNMIVQGQSVYVVWAAGSLPYRHYRFSPDSGQTWNAPVAIFGELHGQAFDGLTVDRAGRVHFFGQIRYPMGIYHAYWDQNRWTEPSLVYLISEAGPEAGIQDGGGEVVEGFGGRVHAHHTIPVVRAGNQLVLTFGDGPADPNRRLFAMHQTLDDIAPLEALPTPTPTATPVLTPISTSTVMATAPSNIAGSQSLEEIPEADVALQFGLFPVLLLLGGMLFVRWYIRKS